MTQQLVFYIDFNKCINCKTCEMACNEYYNLEGVHRRKVVSIKRDSDDQEYHLSISCNHCKHPVCVSICPENNFYKRSDGIVIHQTDNCQACTKCITACPFQALKLNPRTNKADKCNMCVERIDQGLKPVCVENCITLALNIAKIDTSGATPITDIRIPLEGYTRPSIFTTGRQKGQSYLREG